MKDCGWDFTSDIWLVKRSFIWGRFISFFIYLFFFLSQFILPASNNKGLTAAFLPNPSHAHTQTQRSCCLPLQLWGKYHLGSCLSNVDIVLTTLTKSLNIVPLCEFETLCVRQPLRSQRLNMQTLINLYCFFVVVFFLSPHWWNADSIGARRARTSSGTLCLICHCMYLQRSDVQRVCAQRGEFEKGKKKNGVNASLSTAVIEIFPGSKCQEEVYSVSNILSAR